MQWTAGVAAEECGYCVGPAGAVVQVGVVGEVFVEVVVLVC